MDSFQEGRNVLNNVLRKFVGVSITLLFVIVPALSEKCSYVNECVCRFDNGSTIDLSSIGSRNGAKFTFVKPKQSSPYEYYYNPCYAFKLGSGECSKGVAVCQVNPINNTYYDCGDQDQAFFIWDSAKNIVVLRYNSSGNERSTNVSLICPSDPSEEKLEVLGEKLEHPGQYEMVLTTVCACPGYCRNENEGLSTGSSLVIIFFLFVFFYLFFGIIYMHLVRGASGWELIPHHEFWKDLPLLVRDGCVYICSGCRREMSYERI